MGNCSSLLDGLPARSDAGGLLGRAATIDVAGKPMLISDTYPSDHNHVEPLLLPARSTSLNEGRRGPESASRAGQAARFRPTLQDHAYRPDGNTLNRDESAARADPALSIRSLSRSRVSSTSKCCGLA